MSHPRAIAKEGSDIAQDGARAQAGHAAAARPNHVAIIMDGNGRWAQARGLARIEGHRRGLEALRRCVRAAGELGIAHLTVFSFSAENWTRPPTEVSFLMGLLKRFIRNDLAELHAQDVRVHVIGERDRLAPDILAMLREAEELTKGNRGLHLHVAFNYGARQEMTRAMRDIGRLVAAGEIAPDDITPDLIDSHLDTHGVPDPDLIIRTSGEQRLSNFLLWQSVYAEFVFLPVMWPDFDAAMFAAALDEFAHRKRRYGGLDAPAGPGA